MANNNNKGSKRRTPAEVKSNIIIGVVIAVVLGLGIYAVVPKISENINANTSESETEQTQTQTVQMAADSKSMSVEDFINEYGLPEDTTGDTDLSDLYMGMTIENYAKLQERTPDDLLTEMNVADVATKDMTLEEAMDCMTVLDYFGGEETFEQIKEAYGLGDTVTADMRMSDARPIIEAAVQNVIQQQSEASEASDEESADTSEEEAPAATEAPAEN